MLETIGIGTAELLYIIVGVSIISASFTILKEMPKYIVYIALAVGAILVSRGVLTIDAMVPYAEAIFEFFLDFLNKLADIVEGFFS